MKLWQSLLRLADPAWPVRRRTMFWLALATVLLGQLTKLAAVAWLQDQPPVVLWQRFLQLTYRINTGAAFSIFTGRTGLLAAFSALVTGWVVWWGWRLPKAELGLRVALGLILGGAVGNLIDRVRLGYVIDFIDAYWLDPWQGPHWPTFNLADSAICVGMGLLVLASFRMAPAPPAAQVAPAASMAPAGPEGRRRRRG